MINKLLSIALNEVGYLEKASNKSLDDKSANAGDNNYTKYSRDMFGGVFQAQPWCAVFVSWCAKQAGIGEDIFYQHAYCPYGVSWYKNKGRWHDRSGYTPKKGDIIYFQSGGVASHVGLVYDVDSSKVYTVEGNTNGGSTLIANGGGVAKKSYALTYTSILGYATPAYQTLPQAGNPAETEDDDMVKYKKLSDVPDDAKPAVQAAMGKTGIDGKAVLRGDGNGNIDLTETLLRIIVMNYRCGMYK